MIGILRETNLLRIILLKIMRTYNTYIILFLAAGLLGSCSGEQKESSEKEGVETVLPSQVNEVTVMKLKKTEFNHEMVSNGKVVARQYADLSFRVTSEPLAKIYVRNGDRVRKGQKIAELDLFTLNNKLVQAKNSMERALLDMKDVLIGQGYAPDQLDKVPSDMRQLAEVKSGYGQSKASYEMAQYELQQAVIIAPFDGVVANLFAKNFNRPDGSKPFCRVIASGAMEVSFSVLESELPLIQRGDKVKVSPYSASAACTGRVTEINPLVDENGMVKVLASVDGGTKLFDGMNVRVSVERKVKDLFVVPKTALVLRDGKKVIFTLKDGKAMWNYVETGLENLSEYTVTGDGMEEGAVVIVDGNVNLAHEAPVKVVETRE